MNDNNISNLKSLHPVKDCLLNPVFPWLLPLLSVAPHSPRTLLQSPWRTAFLLVAGKTVTCRLGVGSTFQQAEHFIRGVLPAKCVKS